MDFCTLKGIYIFNEKKRFETPSLSFDFISTFILHAIICYENTKASHVITGAV